jgi:2-hydroxy-6-oxonona-2,4-dienedioate hydrolase
VVPLAHRHAVYAVDLPGHGDSEDLPGSYDAGSVSGALGAALDRVLPAPRGYHLCGFSFGGIMSGLAAVGQGARVTTWVGVAPGGLGLPIASLPRLERAGSDLPPERRSEVHRENLQRLMIADPARADDLAVHLQAETVRLARGRSGRIPFTDVLAQALPRVAAPRHAIWGERDVIGGPFLDARRDFFRALDPLGTFQVLAGAGHWLMYEQPEAFEAALGKALEGGGEVGGRDRPAMRR